MRAVIDTNVLISGLFWKGPPNKILAAWAAKRFEWLASADILEEYWGTFDHLSQIHRVPKDSYDFLQALGSNVTIASPIQLREQVCSDPDDDKFVAAALAGRALMIATGDKALLRIDGYQGSTMLKPAAFLKVIT